VVIEHPEVVANRKRAGDWYHANRGRAKENNQRRYQESKEQILEQQRQYRRRNATATRERSRLWREANPERARAGVKKCNSKRLREDPVFRLARGLRKRLNMAVKNNAKTGSAVRDLGCTVAELKAKLESQWKAGWSWENYGTVWVIDHYFPLSWADLEDRTETLAACNHRNLRALSKEENDEKSDSICAQAQHLFSELTREFGDAA